ncbi:hypothetical protein SAMN05444266_101864 [Chitinophaga jiangningensis]|uniref:Uncharacterized protein n=1 Tax=Chitinophaga jiangningensis TaxID=1419482 RepID=A0A1M6X283_9BACT|nr:hypothetical protein [Chitinophaga sp. sic0106]SHL00100.1 hypothetical protein SAMN05444266_101864 [Chitinophaga jiangningensis]
MQSKIKKTSKFAFYSIFLPEFPIFFNLLVLKLNRTLKQSTTKLTIYDANCCCTRT